jgi:hypothetical protein
MDRIRQLGVDSERSGQIGQIVNALLKPRDAGLRPDGGNVRAARVRQKKR